MDNKRINELQAKVTDFTRFAFVLLAVSVFLYIGVLIPNEGKNDWQMYTLMGTTILFLGISFTLFDKVVKYKRELRETEQ